MAPQQQPAHRRRLRAVGAALAPRAAAASASPLPTEPPPPWAF
eukprot:COSAG06_NODE_20616_length_787_cov_88.774709_1_plen_42_part_10